VKQLAIREHDMMNEFSNQELIKWLKLITVGNGLGPVKLQKLLERYDNNLDTIFSTPVSELLSLRFLNEKIINSFNSLKNANDEKFYQLIEICKQNKIKIIPFISNDYPNSLKDIPSPPLTLYLLGNYGLLKKKPSIAIVGTREASQLAKEFARSFGKGLSNSRIIVTSGGALGIDTSAHIGALDSDIKETISVLPTGFFHPYPTENKNLFEDIVSNNGLLISENSPNFKGATYAFLQRNRIISGLADSILIVAAGETGGGLEQIKVAYAQKKPIFCPRLTKNILPNGGIKRAINEYGAIEIDTVDQIIESLPVYSRI
jgi:DNA processing protein